MTVLATEAAPAKVNLTLHVLGRRVDGYHELQSLVAFADVCDELTATTAQSDTLIVSGPFALGLPQGETNLVLRAIAAFRARWPDCGIAPLGIELHKNLPVAAGLGGGSADAAAALRLMSRLSQVPVAVSELSALAATLGADVPVCLLSRPAELRGVGEIVTAVRSFPDFHIVLANPLVPVVTADVFRKLASRDNPPAPPLPQPLSRPELALWLGETRNDMQATAIGIVPAIGELIERLGAAQGCVLARMSGSGATVFGLFGSGALAHQAAHDLRDRWPGYWVAAAPAISAGDDRPPQ